MAQRGLSSAQQEVMKLVLAMFRAWTWRMAWRDSRTSRSRLLLFSSSITLGVAALVAIGSLGRSLQQTVDQQARSLLGADLVVSSRQPIGAEAEALLARLPGEQSREVSFSSMIVFLRDGETRLIQARALEGNFPWYGKIETDPPDAGDAFRNGEAVLIEESLAIQFGAKVGDAVRLGEWSTQIGGILRKVPGDSLIFATLAPRVYFSASAVPKTGLLRDGSLARYRRMFRLAVNFPVETWVKQQEETMSRLKLGVDTVEKRRQDLGNSLGNLQRYLNLAAFIALLLGAVGIASAIHVHVTQKLSNVAVLRCLGASIPQVFAIYLLQAIGLGVIGVGFGVVGGAVVQEWVPRVVQGFIPFEIESHFSWLAAGEASLGGLTLCFLFALSPLLQVRTVPPLAAIRAAFDPPSAARRAAAAAQWFVRLSIVAAISLFAISQTRKVWEGLAFTGGLFLAFGLLAGAAALLVKGARFTLPRGLPFVWRQGIANLYRPNNRTTLLVLALGLGTFLVLTLQLLRTSLLQELFPPGKESQPNAILFDIQTDQRQGVADTLNRFGLTVLEEAPIITMRLASIRGRSIDAIINAKEEKSASWALRREYRSTWRTNLTLGETLVEGRFAGWMTNELAPIPISLEEGIARELGIRLGDEVVFDVQGILLTNQVTSLRKVDWRQIRPNFFIVFPAGSLEAAPSMHVMATHVPNAEASARMQREIVNKFPNVSTVDLTLVLRTLDDIVGRVGLVIRFMALFTVATGLLVLIAAIVTGRWQRVREGILLRTLGATRAQIRGVLFAEYFFLGALAASAGSALAVGSSWALAVYAFKTGYALDWVALLSTVGIVTTLTIVVGLLASRGVCDQPPLEILRREG